MLFNFLVVYFLKRLIQLVFPVFADLPLKPPQSHVSYFPVRIYEHMRMCHPGEHPRGTLDVQKRECAAARLTADFTPSHSFLRPVTTGLYGTEHNRHKGLTLFCPPMAPRNPFPVVKNSSLVICWPSNLRTNDRPCESAENNTVTITTIHFNCGYGWHTSNHRIVLETFYWKCENRKCIIA